MCISYLFVQVKLGIPTSLCCVNIYLEWSSWNSLTGVQGACKAVVSEVSDDSTQAFGVTMLGTSWGLAIIVGPAIGGIISDPIGQYNLTIERELVQHVVCTKLDISLTQP